MDTGGTSDRIPADAGSSSTRKGSPEWIAIVLAVIAGFGPPLAPVSGGLDSGWQLGLSWARTLGLRWGSDILFTYGPLGALAAPVPLSASLAWQAIAAQVAPLALVAWATKRLTEMQGRWWSAVVTIAATAAAASVGIATALFLGVVLCGVASILRSVSARRFAFSLGGIAGLSLLLKFNTGCAAIAIGALVTLAAERRRPALAAFVAGAATGVIGGWVAAGQALALLPYWLRGSIELAVGYPSAMRHVRADLAGWLPLAALLFGLGACALLGGVAWARSAELSTRRRVVLTLAVVAATAALYLASATRLDAGHLGLLPCSLFVLGVPFAASLGSADDPENEEPPGRSSLALSATVVLTVACVSLSVSILGRAGLAQYFHPVSSLETLRNEVMLAASANARSSALDAQRAAIRDAYSTPAWELTTLNPSAPNISGPEPAVVAALRDRSVHVEPWAVGLAWAHRLEWRPVPVLQTYAAYTRRLDEINAAALRSPDGPGGILRQSAAIDGKHPLWESPRYQLAMLCRFTQKATDGHWQALVRDADRCAPPRALGRVTAEAGEMVAVPRAGGSLVIAELRPLPGNQDAGDDAPAALCGAARYPLSQGFPSGPLVLQADASGWSRGSLPQGCETFGANRRVEIVFASIAIRGGI